VLAVRVEPTQLTESDLHPVVQAVVTRRGGAFIELDRALLISLPFAEGWNSFIGKVRSELKLPALYRELSMCAVAGLCKADYELEQHGPVYLAAGGTPARLAALANLSEGIAPVFTKEELALLPLIVAMTTDVEVDDATFAAARAVLPDERELVELVGVTAAYNMVARFLVALKV
jgi:alkylhydroperoxidase family enzyme